MSTFASRRNRADQAERRRCAHVDERMPGRGSSSLSILATRYEAVLRAFSHHDEAEIRDECRQLADEALLLSRSELPRR